MFKQIIITSLFLIACSDLSIAQQPDYIFTRRVENYENLEQPIPISSQIFWYSELWDIPIGFQFKFFDKTFDSVGVYCAASLYFNFSEYEDSLFFSGFSQAITDRGWASSGENSLSPISHMITGEEPERICKIEFKNAGFDYAPIEDSVYIQIWLFEKDNAIEVHLGPHYVTGPDS